MYKQYMFGSISLRWFLSESAFIYLIMKRTFYRFHAALMFSFTIKSFAVVSTV